MVLVPAPPILLSPCARPPSSFLNAVVQISHMTGSFASSSYLSMVCPVLGTTGLENVQGWARKFVSPFGEKIIVAGLCCGMGDESLEGIVWDEMWDLNIDGLFI